jgi:putative ABC transport system substrate-binding protein
MRPLVAATPDMMSATAPRTDRAAMNWPRRRALAMCLGTVALAARAAPELPMPPGGRRWRIGWLLVASPDNEISRQVFEAFRAGLRDKGWVEGVHYTIETRSSGGDVRRFPALAAELVQLAPDVLMAVETTALVLWQHTTTIPIVLWASLDPVAVGLVHSLARPGTNVTGLSSMADDLIVKSMEGLFEIVPRARRVALLHDPHWSAAARQIEIARRIAQARGAVLDAVPITADGRSVSAAFAGFDRQRPDGLVILNNAAILAQANSLQAGVLARRLPAAGLIEAGAVVRTHVDVRGNVREAAEVVDRILRGAAPADLPVRQARSVIVTLHLKRARELGIDVPHSLRVRADEVIE